MTRQRISRAAMFLAVLSPLGFALQDPQPPPRPDPAPAPAESDAQREERTRQERLDRERKQDEERRRQEAEKQRVQKERERVQQQQQQERDRAARARDQSRTREGSAPRTPEQTNKLRATARNLFEVERLHRSHVARIERLMDIYRESGDREKLVELEKLRAKADQRYERFVARYKEEMGPAFGEVQPHLEAGKGRTSTRPRRDNNDFGTPTRQRNPNTKTGGGQ